MVCSSSTRYVFRPSLGIETYSFPKLSRALLFALRKKERVGLKNQPKLGERNKRDFLRHPIFIDSFVLCGWKTKKRVRYLRGIFSYQQVFFFFSLLLQQARDLNINQSTRGDGASRFALQKLSTEQTAARAKEAAARLSGEVSEYVNKKYWTQAGNALRRAVYTLRFDVNNLVAEKGGDADAAKDLFKTIESLDFAIRSKDLDTASPRWPRRLPPRRTPSSPLSNHLVKYIKNYLEGERKRVCVLQLNGLRLRFVINRVFFYEHSEKRERERERGRTFCIDERIELSET